MSPKLTGKEANVSLDGKKYVRVGREIASLDEGDDAHIEIALKHFPNQPIESGYKPVVDDKGVIEVIDGKLADLSEGKRALSLLKMLVMSREKRLMK